jgi:hypothetical protein
LGSEKHSANNCRRATPPQIPKTQQQPKRDIPVR